MKKYVRVLKKFIGSSLAAQAGFRADFIIGIIMNISWIIMFFFLIAIVFSNTGSVAGWSRNEAIGLFGLFSIMDGFVASFLAANMASFSQMVRDGGMDYVVTKPLDAQFQISFRQVNTGDVADIGIGVLALSYALVQAHYIPTLWHIVATLVVMVLGAIISYSIWIIAAALSFWFIRLDNIGVLVNVTFTMARYPLNIFEGIVKNLVFYVVPIAFFATIPAMMLFGKADPLQWISIGAALAIIIFIIARLIWLAGVRSYSSASS